MSDKDGDPAEPSGDDARRLSDPVEPSLTAIAVAGGIVAGGTLPLGPIGAILTAVLTPGLAKVLQTAASEWKNGRDTSVLTAISEGAERAHLSLEGLLDEIGQHPEKLALLSDVVDFAGRTRNEQKVRALGAVLANGATARDDALIDQERIRARVLDDLEAPHIQTLQIIAEGSTTSWPAQHSGVNERAIGDRRRGLDGTEDRGLLQLILRVLDRNGLIYQTAIGEPWDENPADDIRADAGSNEWAITRFGRSILQDLLDSRLPTS